jgi:hypothetical protein
MHELDARQRALCGLESFEPQQVDTARLSFLDALRWRSTSSTRMPLSALLVNPARPQRVEPRVKKRRPKAFPFMVKPQHELRRQLMQQTVGA